MSTFGIYCLLFALTIQSFKISGMKNEIKKLKERK
jgi:hypothetical protein